MESTDSSSVPPHPQLPPGYRFHPTDEELVVHYLKKKIASDPLPVSIITEIDLYKFDPWELPGKASFGDQEWYFFSPRDRKYPNGARPNRAATSGYWKATGTDKPILTGGGTQKIAVKKALVFYSGKPPKGIKTNWIMHEYRLLENSGVMKPPGTKKNSSRLDDWVLCRIYKKNNSQRSIEIDREAVSMDSGQQQTLTRSNNGGFFMENNETTFFDGLLHDSTSGHLHTSLKRNLPAQYWNETVGSESSEKRFQTSTGSNSVANLHNQIPQQSSSFNQQMLLGSLGDGVYRQQQYHVPGINWNP